MDRHTVDRHTVEEKDEEKQKKEGRNGRSLFAIDACFRTRTYVPTDQIVLVLGLIPRAALPSNT